MSDHLRRLAQTVPQLLLTVAQRLEMDHGKELVSKCLLTLQLSRQGTYWVLYNSRVCECKMGIPITGMIITLKNHFHLKSGSNKTPLIFTEFSSNP